MKSQQDKLKGPRAVSSRRCQSICRTSFWRALFAEFTGTLLLVTLTAGTLRTDPDTTEPPGVPHLRSTNHLVIHHLYMSLVTGAVICGLTVAMSSACCTHFNPVLTLSFLITRRLGLVETVCLVIAQVAGCIIGSALAYGTTYDHHNQLHPPDFTATLSPVKLITVEALSAFVFALVYFASSDCNLRFSATQRGVALGSTALGMQLFSAPYTATFANPCRTFGPAIIRNIWHQHWVYWVGPGVGACMAAICYEFVFATNASISKGLSYLHDSQYNPHAQAYGISKVQDQCCCENNCCQECDQLRLYKDYMLRVASLQENSDVEQQQQDHLQKQQQQQQQAEVEHVHRVDFRMNSYQLAEDQEMSAYQPVRLSSSSTGSVPVTDDVTTPTSSFLDDNISLDLSHCEERVSVL